MLIRNIITFAILTGLCGCDGDKPLSLKRSSNEYTIEIQMIQGSLERSECTRLMKAGADAFSVRLDLALGEDSLIEKLNRERGPMEVSPELRAFLARVKDLKAEINNVEAQLLDIRQRLPGTDSSEVKSSPTEEVSASEVRIVLDGDSVTLEGKGILELGSAVVGWAIDGAAQVMLDGGVEAAFITTGDITRLWGQPDPERKWDLTVKASPDDSTEYRFSPEAGGLYRFDQGEEESGTDRDLINLVVWAPDAMCACVFGETLYTMERGDLLRCVQMMESVGVFFIRMEGSEMIAESDFRMSSWVSMHMP